MDSLSVVRNYITPFTQLPSMATDMKTKGRVQDSPRGFAAGLYRTGLECPLLVYLL